MKQAVAGYVSPKIVARPVRIGIGLVLTEPVEKDELLVDFEEHGVPMGEYEAWLQESRGNHYVTQVDDHVYQVTLSDPCGIDFLNHCCQSNCGMRGSFQVVARRPIAQGEVLTLDYALTETHPWYRLACRCGHERCRGTVSGRDWRRRSVQEEYAGYFASHIQRRIDLNPAQAFWRNLCEEAHWSLKWVFERFRRRCSTQT